MKRTVFSSFDPQRLVRHRRESGPGKRRSSTERNKSQKNRINDLERIRRIKKKRPRNFDLDHKFFSRDGRFRPLSVTLVSQSDTFNPGSSPLLSITVSRRTSSPRLVPSTSVLGPTPFHGVPPEGPPPTWFWVTDPLRQNRPHYRPESVFSFYSEESIEPQRFIDQESKRQSCDLMTILNPSKLVFILLYIRS